MIKIKNHIYNENEIISIHESTENDSISIKFKTDSYFILENATFEDIEWNYENNNEYCNVFYEDRIKELEEENKTLKELNVCVGCDNNPDYKTRIKELEEENKKLNELVQFNVKTTTTLTKRINKAIEYIEEHKRNVYDTFGEGIVFGEMGGIKEIIKILKGEEK